ncbi:MAG TPA: hypothetical protein DCZ43_05795, partial [candidate division Zixibacteria bacterium]|nr:hypothetical protein [candidate division Zixibacteria bacterium]
MQQILAYYHHFGSRVPPFPTKSRERLKSDLLLREMPYDIAEKSLSTCGISKWFGFHAQMGRGTREPNRPLNKA